MDYSISKSTKNWYLLLIKRVIENMIVNIIK